ncbi:Mannose-6-phosphate isomerase [Termitomyces sp. T112]|nr:Mannose-6-phosphate isomerase [Termitomyces sp. T112]
MSTIPVFKIAPTIQQYDWGKPGSTAKVAQFATTSKLPGFTIDQSAPYAELWMGTHVKSPSRVYSTGEVLSEHLAKHPELIGASVSKKFDASNGNLPFLFKVLSIEKALSIQSHPDKATAAKLHAAQPDIYKDPNHKPEMTLALTPFLALCGFRPLSSIASSLKHTPEFAALIPQHIQDAFLSLSTSSTPTGPLEKAALRDLFEAVMTADSGTFKPQLETLVERYKRGAMMHGEIQDLADLVLRCHTQFPGDIGSFCAFLLNYVTLKPGEAIFLGAGEPHAYVSGECIECMANSDNVIRAGLTPKLRDIPNLISTLTYTASPPTKHYVFPSPFTTDNATSSASTLYDPPIPEFSVVEVKLAPRAEEMHRPVMGPSIMIVTDGEGIVRWGQPEKEEKLDVGLGDVFFVGAGTEVTFCAKEKEFVAYRALVEAD